MRVLSLTVSTKAGHWTNWLTHWRINWWVRRTMHALAMSSLCLLSSLMHASSFLFRFTQQTNRHKHRAWVVVRLRCGMWWKVMLMPLSAAVWSSRLHQNNTRKWLKMIPLLRLCQNILLRKATYSSCQQVVFTLLVQAVSWQRYRRQAT